MRESKILQRVPASIAASSKRSMTSPRAAGLDWFFNMSKTVGNQALQRYLISGFSKIPRQGTVIQRAIGVELEDSNWETTTPEGIAFEKYAPLVRDDENGFTLSADEYLMPTRRSSNLEFVSDAHPDKEAFLGAVQSMDELARQLESHRVNENEPIVLENVLGKAGNSGEVEPYKQVNSANINPKTGKFSPHVQVTMSVPLGKIAAMFDMLANKQENLKTSNYAGPVVKLRDRLKMMEKTFEKRHKKLGLNHVKKMSPQLTGLSTMIAYYLRSSFVPMENRKNLKRQFPKALFPVLAKIPFHLMFELLPDHELKAIRDNTGHMKAEWISWFLEGALGNHVTSAEKKGKEQETWADIWDGPLLPQTFGEGGEEPYEIKLKRANWLHKLPKNDLLTEQNNPKLKGMGVFSGKGDVRAGDSNSDQEKYAPVFELRDIGENPTRESWKSWAEKWWGFYEDLVGQGVRYEAPKKVKPTDASEKGSLSLQDMIEIGVSHSTSGQQDSVFSPSEDDDEYPALPAIPGSLLARGCILQ